MSLFAINNTYSPWTYYRTRNYNPSTGRFISEDPIGFAGEDSNLYRYVRNNSISYNDPSGLLVLYAGFSGIAGYGTGNGDPNLGGGGLGAYIGNNNCSDLSSTGNYGQTFGGRIAGITAGIGFNVGFNVGDVKDFNGEGSSVVFTLLGVSGEVTFGGDGSFSGLNVGIGGKGYGAGTFGTESKTGLIGGRGSAGKGPSCGCK